MRSPSLRKQDLSSMEAISVLSDIKMRFLSPMMTCAQRAEFIRHYLQNLRVERMEWYACSPDLSPAEHLWDQPTCVVHATVTNTTTLADLQQMLEECDAIAQQCDKARDQHE